MPKWQVIDYKIFKKTIEMRAEKTTIPNRKSAVNTVNRLKLCGNWPFQQNFHTKKLYWVTAFFALDWINIGSDWIRTRKTTYLDTFHAVVHLELSPTSMIKELFGENSWQLKVKEKASQRILQIHVKTHVLESLF